jgi:hypothetical protein
MSRIDKPRVRLTHYGVDGTFDYFIRDEGYIEMMMEYLDNQGILSDSTRDAVSKDEGTGHSGSN